MLRPADAVPVAALRTVLAPVGELDRAELLTGGMFATTYRAHLRDGRRVVVKTAPTQEDRLLTYERDLLRTEALVYRLGAGRPDLLLPEVLHEDLTRSVLPSDVLVVSHLPGTPLVDAGDLPPAAADAVQRGLGAFMARLHAVRGDVFGYPNAATGLQAPTWPEAVGLAVGALLDDARRWGTPLPDAEVHAALARSREALAEVTVPSLVHTDLWAGNLFVDPATGGLTGVIDTERAVWGDPLLDLVGADQLGRGPAPAALLEGYDAQGGDLGLRSAAGRRRLLVYRLWMSLVLLVEMAPRGYAGPAADAHRATAAGNLRAALDALAVPDGA
ncbi:phosphotransferase family protein [Actinotalea solisilvae]|uniref:phosphotransferase family protein n=1 Tax=Actinotalea solisilvae TaxID=2072922 RepID=UPI0027DE71A4|nr:aminoglycoside phosphotransferase family protein [Actinotalea solisilvae]